MRKQLTEPMIEKLRPPAAGRAEIFNSIVSGLTLRVTAKGAKSFVIRARVKGHPRPIRVTIGDARGMKLSDARREAMEVLQGMPRRLDPRVERRNRVLQAQRADSLQFDRVVEVFIEKHAKKNRSWRDTEAVFRNHVTPRWKGRRLDEISRSDVVALLDKIEERGSVYAANRTLAAVRKLMNWAILRGLISPPRLLPAWHVKAKSRGHAILRSTKSERCGKRQADWLPVRHVLSVLVGHWPATRRGGQGSMAIIRPRSGTALDFGTRGDQGGAGTSCSPF